MKPRDEHTHFPDYLRDPERFRSRFDWHRDRARWLKARNLKGALNEVRAMTNPELSDRLAADPDSSIGGVSEAR